MKTGRSVRLTLIPIHILTLGNGASRSCQLFHINCMTVTPYIKKMSSLNDIFFLNVVSALDCYRAALAYHRYIIIGLRFFDMNTFLEISIRMHLDL